MSQEILLNTSNLKDLAIPFNEINVDDYLPSLTIAITEAKKNIEQIKNQTETSFANTILALEQASEKVDRISNIYFNLFSAEASEEHQALAQHISPLLSSFSSDISLDEKLFSKIRFVYENREKLNLKGEDLKLTEKYYLDFSRNGALLDSSKKDELRQLDQELSILSPQFSENVLKATNAFELWIESENDLAGLPEGVREAAQMAAEAKGKKGQWLFSLQAPSLIPFLTYADNRSLREKIWRANSSKSFGGEFDNQEIVKKIVKLKSNALNY